MWAVLKLILDIIWPLDQHWQHFKLKNQRNWLKPVWMLNFWSASFCTEWRNVSINVIFKCVWNCATNTGHVKVNQKWQILGLKFWVWNPEIFLVGTREIVYFKVWVWALFSNLSHKRQACDLPTYHIPWFLPYNIRYLVFILDLPTYPKIGPQ